MDGAHRRNSLIRDQIAALEDLYKYIEDTYLESVDQQEVRRRCLDEWDLPITSDASNVRLRRAARRARDGERR